MNIKKKISFFALFLISSFFIVGEVKGDTYYRYGETGGMGLYSNATSGLESTLTSSYYAYRFTFVKSDGSIVSGTKPVDIYFTGNPINYGTYYKTYKFSDKTYDISTKIVNINKCSTDDDPDECYMSNIISYYKNNTSSFKSQLLGLTGNKKFDDGEFLVVEKLYTINVKTATLKPITKDMACNQSKYDQIKKELIDTIWLDCSNMKSDAGQPVAHEFNNIKDNYYTGTGLNLLNFLKDIDSGQSSGKLGTDDYNYYYFGMWTDRDNVNKTAGLYFVKNNLMLNNFSGDLKLNSKIDKFKKIGANTAPDFSRTANKNTLNSNIDKALSKNRGYGINVFEYKKFEEPGCTYDNHTVYDGGRDWDFSSNTCCKEGTYYKHAVGDKKNGACCPNSTDEYDKLQGCVTKGTCTKDNHNRLNKDWNSKKNVCCNVGELFNGTDCTTKAAPTASGIKTVYNFTTINSINTCTSNGVNSLISNFVKKSASKTQNGKNVKINPKEADFLLYNNKYKVIFNKETLYCNEKLETQFDGFTKNFGNLFSGKFILLKELPTISKTVSCYIVDPNAGTSNGKNSVGASYVNKVSKIGINFNFLGGKYNYKYLFKSPTATTPDGVKTEVGTTSYNVKYTKFSATINYQFSEISINNKSVENKNINILTAKNLNSISTIMQENKTYKTIDSLSIQIPTDIPTGTYTNSISLTNLDNALEKIKNQDPSHYSFAKSNPNGNCIFKYTIKGTDIDNCGEKYRSAIKTPISASFGVSYTGKFNSKTKECNFTITLSSSSSNLMTQDLCKSYKTLPGVSGIPQVSFNSASNTTEIYFKNESVSGDPTKSCKFNINIKDYELVFRPISLSDPFPGSNGKGRTPNSKVWTSEKIGRYISSRKDAYTKKPLYSVTLTSSQIKNIRKYNKNHKYDDFNLKCVGSKTGTACYSDFIRTYLNTNKSVCANTNDQSEKSFNSCADYSKRQ